MKNTMDKSYNIPVVPPDLRQEETILQICDSLAYLDKVASDVFSRIGSRVSDNHTRLRAINDRINLAQAKIDKIKGSKKATKVFSSAKYPQDAECQFYNSIYSSQNDLQELKRANYKLQTKHKTDSEAALREKLQFYNFKFNVNDKRRGENKEQEEGLGGLPKNIPSISSLLLFNTAENPYKKYVMLDPLGVVTKTRKGDEDADEGLAEAPSTITGREELMRGTKENYLFKPGLGEVPEIAVPDFLPDLVGVADDLSYSAELGPSIAPSVPGSNMPDLPAVIPEEIDIIPDGPAAPGGPPPPPPPGAPPAAPPPPVSAPPPPPPPAADEEDGPPTKASDSKPTDLPPEVEDAGDARGSLLAAIRNAGGAGKARLKNVKDRKIEKKKKQEEAKAAPTGGGDLMGDLAAKLQMRRKGISGTKKAQDQSDGGSSSGGGSAMDKISSMIPAPPHAGGGSSKHDEDDWD